MSKISYCLLCKSKKIKIKKKIYSNFVHKEYYLYKCNNCKSEFFDYKQYKINFKELYSNIANKFTEKGNLLKIRDSQKWKFYKNLIMYRIKNIETVMDVGCRTGDFLIHMPKKIKKTGIELSQETSLIAKKRGLKVITKSIESYKFDNKYDLITLFGTLEHLKKPFAVLKKIIPTVKEGGVILIVIPDCNSYKNKILDFLKDSIWSQYTPPCHLYFFSDKILDVFFGENNFKKIYRGSTSGQIISSEIKNKLFRSVYNRIRNKINFSNLGKFTKSEVKILMYKKM